MDDSVAFATVLPIPTIVTLVAVLLLGYVSALCIPRLPLGVPRRDFGYDFGLLNLCQANCCVVYSLGLLPFKVIVYYIRPLISRALIEIWSEFSFQSSVPV